MQHTVSLFLNYEPHASVHIFQQTTVYHESFEAEKFRGFRGSLLLRETFFHEIFQLLLKSGRL